MANSVASILAPVPFPGESSEIRSLKDFFSFWSFFLFILARWNLFFLHFPSGSMGDGRNWTKSVCGSMTRPATGPVLKRHLKEPLAAHIPRFRRWMSCEGKKDRGRYALTSNPSRSARPLHQVGASLAAAGIVHQQTTTAFNHRVCNRLLGFD